MASTIPTLIAAVMARVDVTGVASAEGDVVIVMDVG